MKQDRGAVVIGLLGTLAAAGIVGTIAAVVFGGDDNGDAGKTGPTPGLPFDVRGAVGAIVCACVDAGASGLDEITACAARAHWSDLDYTWPPPANAHVEHAEAWGELRAALDGFTDSADAAGVTLCEFLIDGPPPGPDPTPPLPVKPVEPLAPVPTPTPTPGSFYMVASGDTFFGTVGDAYGVGSGQQRLMLAKKVNTHPTNKARARYFSPPQSAPEFAWFDGSLISYGVPYQLVYFPTVAELEAI